MAQALTMALAVALAVALEVRVRVQGTRRCSVMNRSARETGTDVRGAVCRAGRWTCITGGCGLRGLMSGRVTG